MKTRRFFSLFFLMSLLFSLWTPSRAAAVDDPQIQAKAALLVDAQTGSVAYAKNEHEELYPSSLVKIMTTLLTLEAVENGQLTLDQMLTASDTVKSTVGGDGSFVDVKAGETLSVTDLLYLTMLVSSNKACDVLAEAVSGSVEAFVAAMNEKAAALGCENTHFTNPSGLHDEQQYTSAWDLYLITKAAMAYPDFLSICDKATVTIPATNLTDSRTIWTTNHLLSTWRVLGYRDSDAHGIKDGSTTEAGYCLVSSAQRDDLQYISVILGAERIEENGKGNLLSFSETSRLFDYGFDSFSYQTILEAKEPIDEVPVLLSKSDYVTVHPAKDVEVLFPTDLEPSDLKRDIQLQESVEAPVHAGQKLGTMELRYGDQVYAQVDLLAMGDVEASGILVFWRDTQLFFAKTSVRVALIILGILLVGLLIWRVFFSRRRYRYGRSVGRGQSRYRGRKHR